MIEDVSFFGCWIDLFVFSLIGNGTNMSPTPGQRIDDENRCRICGNLKYLVEILKFGPKQLKHNQKHLR